MRVTAQGFYNSSTRWNKAQWDEWFSNPHDSPLRRRWVDSWERLAQTPQAETGLQLVYDEEGAATFASGGGVEASASRDVAHARRLSASRLCG